MNDLFSPDVFTQNAEKLIEGGAISDYAAVIDADADKRALEKGEAFAEEIADGFISDFEKPGAQGDRMAHVSTFVGAAGNIYVSYYANTGGEAEDPKFQTARLAYCPCGDTDDKTFLDIMSVGGDCAGRKTEMVYDTVLMQKDENTLYVMWTASVGGNYFRFYRPFDIPSGRLGDIGVNRFRAGGTVNDFSSSGIRSALTAEGIGFKKMYSDIGVMQKLSRRVENGVTYYYTGAYSGDFNCIIKSRDLVTWEYVAAPDFPNMSKWENAVYTIGGKCFYFVRQHDEATGYGFLTSYDLLSGKWETPVLIADCQSRSDFITYKGGLYLFHAPVDREHIGVVRVDTENIAESRTVLQAHMRTSCFYPFVQYLEDGSLAMSYTVDRKHIRLARFDMSKYAD